MFYNNAFIPTLLEKVKKTYDLVISMAKIYDKNMDKYLEYTKFPTFKI